MKHFENLFQEMKIGRRTVKNRIVQSPVGELMANSDGSPSDQMMAYYEERAKGGAAIITPAVFCVDYPKGKTVKLQVRVDDVKCVKDLERMAEKAHRYGALFIPQIHHAGAQTFFLNTEGNMPLCVSNKDVNHAFVQGYRMAGPQKELTTEEIKELVQKFIFGAINCKNAGCDGVSIHAAHGYLINQFLSPDMNARTDEYGGSLENRTRFAVEVLRGIRQACGPAFVIGARIPGKEWVPTGLSDEECVEIAKIFEAAGCDYLDVSGGATDVASKLMETEIYPQGDRVVNAERIKKAVSIPVGAVGVLREPAYCDKIIREGKVDFVSLGRTLVRDPFWPQKAQEGRVDEIRPCMSCCDGCVKRIVEDKFVTCSINPVTGRELELGRISKTETPKNVVVIGGGVGGMQAAITASDAGHRVTLLEKSDTLGGQMNLACIPPNKGKIKEAKEWYAREVKRRNIDVQCNFTADLDSIKAMAPEGVIVATGALPITKIPVEGLEHTVQAWDILNGNVEVPHQMKVAIIGGGIVACEIAQMMIRNDNAVSILEMLPQIANGLEGMHVGDMLAEFAAHGVNVQTNATATKISADAVTFVKDGKEESLESDMIVLAAGQRPEGLELVRQLKDEGMKVVVIGDVKNPSKILNATLDAYYAGLDI